MLGERFGRYRVALGLTQAELSEKVGVSKMTIHKFDPFCLISSLISGAMTFLINGSPMRGCMRKIKSG